PAGCRSSATRAASHGVYYAFSVPSPGPVPPRVHLQVCQGALLAVGRTRRLRVARSEYHYEDPLVIIWLGELIVAIGLDTIYQRICVLGIFCRLLTLAEKKEAMLERFFKLSETITAPALVIVGAMMLQNI